MKNNVEEFTQAELDAAENEPPEVWAEIEREVDAYIKQWKKCVIAAMSAKVSRPKKNSQRRTQPKNNIPLRAKEAA
ncbi:MAG: hypothetical protein ABIR24_12890 [Verrucomicrobiota bacterium]